MNLDHIEHPLVIYHDRCGDGWAAAFLATRRWSDAELRPANHGDEPPYEDAKNRNVLVLDFSFSRERLEKLRAVAKTLLVLDHHASAQRDLDGLDYCVFDMNRSGAGLVLDFFFPGHRDPRRIGRLPWADAALYAEDRDLWSWKKTASRQVNTFLEVTPRTVEAWETLPSIVSMQEQGEAMLAYQKHLVDDIAARAYPLVLVEGEVLAVNTPVLQSEVGNALALRAPAPLRTALVWSRAEDGKFRCSFRSVDGGADVSYMAKTRGGGGHKHAAGYTQDGPPTPVAR